MSNFLSNVLKLVSGSIIAQMLGVLLIPVVTRLYSPDDLGILQLFTSMLGIIAMISCFTYHFAIMLPKKEEDSINIVAFSILLTLLTSIFVGIICLSFNKLIGEILNAPMISDYLILFPIAVFLNGLFFIGNYWLSRKVRFGIIALSRISNTLSSKFFQVGYAFISASPFGLVFGLVLGYAIAVFMMIIGMKKDIHLYSKISAVRMKDMAYTYKRFPMFTSWSSLINTISLQVPVFMLALFYSTEIVGYFSIANMAISLPMSLIGTAIAQVFFQRVSEEKNRTGNVKYIVENVHEKLVSIGIFPIILLTILSEDVFGIIFGDNWMPAGTYTMILAPWMFFMLISSPLSMLFNVFEKQEKGLIFNAILLISRILVLFIGGTYGTPIFTLILFSLSGVFSYAGLTMYLLKIANVSCIKSIDHILKYSILALVTSFPIIVAKFVTSFNLYLIGIIAGISALIYYIIIIYKDNDLKKIVQNKLKSYNITKII